MSNYFIMKYRNFLNSKILFIITFFMISLSLYAENIVLKNNDSLNAVLLRNNDSNISFLAGGHLYGSPFWHGTQYPAPSIMENVERFNKMKLDFFMCLGDIVNGTTDTRLEIIDRSFIKKLKIPVFNSLGNHDFSQNYKEYFKIEKYYYSFKLNNNLFIVLDTETNSGEIKGLQLEFFKNEIKKANKNIKNVFIFSHKLIWAYALKNKYNTVYNHLNAKNGYKEDDNFKTSIMPILLKSKKSIYWISGDIGAHNKTLETFYDQYNDQITFMAIGLGDTYKDMLLKTKINKNGKVEFNLISLIDLRKSVNIKQYGVKYWQGYFTDSSKDIIVRYINRTRDKWSEGKSVDISLIVKKDFEYEYELIYFTSNPSKEKFEVIIKMNNKIIETKIIKSKKKYVKKFIVGKGNNSISIKISKTFNPKKLGMSNDGRDLGVNITLKKRNYLNE